MKRIVIIGASSGLGYAITQQFASMGWKIGIASRRETPLQELQSQYPDNIVYSIIDITADNATDKFDKLIELNGGMDILLLASGIGKQNPELDISNEETTIKTNVLGFTRIVDTAFNYFKNKNTKGQIAIISSVAGTKGLGIAASYSATKRFQNSYISALEQLANIKGVNISFTDIRPGFIRTALLDENKSYPMIMTVEHATPIIVNAILKNKRIAIIDWRWRILVGLWRLIPHWLWIRLKINNT